MNDRFKFRAYNKELRKMYEVDTICPYEDNYTKGGEVFLKGVQYNSFYFPEEVEVMQCTGLKDCTDKLIYEDDILDVMGFVLHKVIWNQEYCRFELKTLSGETKLDDWLEDTTGENSNHRIKIKGNIYENPELLEENDG